MLVHRVLLLAVLCLGGTASETKNQPETNEEKIKAISGGAKKLVDDMQSLLNKQKQLAKQRQAISQAKQDLLDRVRTYSEQKTAETLQMVKTYDSQLKAHKAEVQKMDAKLRQMNDSANREIHNLQRKLNARIKSLSQEKSAVDSRLAKLIGTDRIRLAKLTDANKKLVKQLEDGKAELDRGTERYEALKKELEREKKRLQNETARLEQVKDEITKEEDALRKDEAGMRELNNKLLEQGKQNKNCDQELAAVTKDHNNARESVKTLTSNLASCNSRLEEQQHHTKELTTELETAQDRSTKCNAALNKVHRATKELTTRNEKILAELADLRKVEDQHMATIRNLQGQIAALQKEQAAIGEKCSEANTHCMEGLACSDAGICVPVCQEVLAPDVVNARVDWQKADGAYVGSITCNNASIYTGGSEPLTLVCHPNIGLWKTAMTGNCSQSQWTAGQIKDLVQYGVPKQPRVGWAVCLEGHIAPNEKYPEPQFSISLGDKEGQTLFRFTFGGTPVFQAEHLPNKSGTTPFVLNVNKAFIFKAGEKITLSMKVTKSNMIEFSVNGAQMADVKFEDFRGKNIVENVAELHLSGAIAASYLNLWCGK